MIAIKALKKKLDNIFCRIMPFFVVLFYLADGVGKYSRSIGGDNVSLYFRLLFVLLVAFYVMLTANKILNSLVLLLFLISILISGYLLNGLVYNENDMLSSFYIAARYLSFFVLFLSCSIIKTKKVAIVFFYIFLINAILAWLGFALDIELFRTYGHIRNIDEGWVDQRFGFNGLILEQNNATFFYIFGLCLSFYLWSDGRVNIIVLVFVIVSCFLVGTKSLWGATILITLSFVFKNGWIRHCFLIIFALTVGFVVIIYADYISFDVVNYLLSGRLLSLTEKFIPIFLGNVQIDTFLFGIQGGDYKRFLVEMDFIDFFSFFGLLGSVVVMIILYSGLYFARVSLFNYGLIIMIVFLVSALSGHLFYDPVASFYFCFFIMACRELTALRCIGNKGDIVANC